MQTENAQQKYCFALIGICFDLRCVYKQTKYDKINRRHSAYMGTNVITLHRFYEYFIGYSCPDVCKWSLSCRCLSNMLLVLLISFCHYYIQGCVCSTCPFQFRWLKGYIHSSCYYHHQIGSINVTHCYHIFPWLCAWDVCYIIFCHLLHIHSEKTRILFSLLLCCLWWVQIVRYILACRSYSFLCTLHHIIIAQTFLKTLNL